MSTSASALSSAAAVTYFNGMSTYSSSLNSAISRAVQIADLPIQLLQNDVNNLTNQTTELQTLTTDFTNVQSAVASLASAAGNMLSASVSDGSATATVGSAATAGSYSLAVDSLGSYSNALSDDGLTTVTDPTSQNISSSASFTLSVTTGAASSTNPPVVTSIAYSGGNLNGLAQAINDQDAGVQATVVDVGSNSAPDYRLSLQSDSLGDVTMQLNDGSQDLETASGVTGTVAEYSINGQPVSSDSDTVTLAPGLTVLLTGTNSSPATVTVAADPSGVGSALQSLVSAYNTANTELANNRGQTDVALAGQSIVYELTEGLQSLANFPGGSGNISSLAALGVSFSDTTGQLSFDQSTFDAATTGQTAALTQFLGTAAGGGYLEAATNTMTGIMDPTTGILPQDIASIQANIASTNTQITTQQTQVTQMQSNLTQQMAAADASIYDLQQQASEMQDMFTAEQDSEMMG
ncbi:MAG TPA: flagellar filament capping protein FliD [Bryobacteraceae bacterium]|nr:flagellar filament capping protein FliD [Bryobacteraceae bacterium]